MNMIKLLLKLFFGLLLISVAVIVGPLLILWALNTLFPAVAIPYTWQTWASAFILSAPFSAGAFGRTRKN